MIKSAQGTVEIDGMQGEILLDFAHIYSQLIEIVPEIVAATVLHYGDKLQGAGIDKQALAVAEMLLSHIIEDDEDDDNE